MKNPPVFGLRQSFFLYVEKYVNQYLVLEIIPLHEFTSSACFLATTTAGG